MVRQQYLTPVGSGRTLEQASRKTLEHLDLTRNPRMTLETLQLQPSLRGFGYFLTNDLSFVDILNNRGTMSIMLSSYILDYTGVKRQPVVRIDRGC